MLVLLLAVIPVLGGLIALGYSVFLWVKIGQRFDRTGVSGARGPSARDRRVGVRVQDHTEAA